MPARRPDVPSLVAGLAIAALGVLLLLDDRNDLELGFGVLAPAMFAAIGAIFLAMGLSRRG
jgi:hypothetical protein